MSTGKIGICKFCNRLKYLPGGGTYCTTCYRKFIRRRQECKRCHKLKTIAANGYCGSCYNYIMGYYEKRGAIKFNGRMKRKIKPQKCFFCNEKRPEMLEVYRKKGAKDDDINNFVLLCPSHHREVQLGIKSL